MPKLFPCASGSSWKGMGLRTNWLDSEANTPLYQLYDQLETVCISVPGGVEEGETEGANCLQTSCMTSSFTHLLGLHPH